MDRISPIEEIKEENFSILKDLKEIGREIDSKDFKYSRQSNKMHNISVDYNMELLGNTCRSAHTINNLQKMERKLKRNNTIYECSTQTDIGNESIWSSFMKIFQCGR